jgi:hypothetical protein
MPDHAELCHSGLGCLSDEHSAQATLVASNPAGLHSNAEIKRRG